MKKLIRIIVVLAVVAVVVVAAALVIGYLSINIGVEKAIETFGSKYAGVPVTVESVSISPFSGEGEIHGLVIGNPPDFKTPYAFSLDQIAVKLDIGSLRTDTIVIERFLVEAPRINYELGLRESNVGRIKKNIETALPTSGDGDFGDDAAVNDKGGKKVIIDDLRLANGEIEITTKILQNTTASAKLPKIHLTEIGRKSEGATAVEAMNHIYRQVFAGIFESVSEFGVLASVDAGAVKGAVDAAKKSAANLVKGAKGLLKGLKGKPDEKK